MSADIILCEHHNDTNTCEICKKEGEEFRHKVRNGELPCPICNGGSGDVFQSLGLCYNGLIVHRDRDGWVIRRYDPSEPMDFPWDVYHPDGWGAAVCLGMREACAYYDTRDEAMNVAESLKPTPDAIRHYGRPDEMIPLEDCKNLGFYRLDSRNLSYGVFVKGYNGFIGIRTKFKEVFLDVEDHWDTGEPHGTAKPLEYICDCPITNLRVGIVNIVVGKKEYKQNQELFDWIEENGKEE